ncbi:hypothetical protein J0X14_01570 [Muricauda sp. CAU 1633]|uniref:DUF6427 family protein n=1 Tax=Allomuricauda sp. CAU 1633 TaxID=2816036 RepID=UPI001A8D08CD|nr:DUF6427 family protein [Muricauda sp. CAU 1633]MBO0320968.1 hypothetical protein [Muricauda sp. CAU 1633]
MISSFFGKTKPINYIVLGIFLFLFYSINAFLGFGTQVVTQFIALELLAFAVLLLALFIINQIVRTEKVTDFNSYAMLFFVLLLVAFSETLFNKNVIFTNFFLLLAFWRLLSIKSIRFVKHKIFDASFLIGAASLFYDWSLVFLLLVFAVINVYDRKNFKNWLVPFVGMATVFIITFAALRLTGSTDFFGKHYVFSIGLLKTETLGQVINIKTMIYILLMLLLMMIVFVRVRSIGGGKLVLLRIMLFIFILGVVLALFSPAGSSPLLFTFFPAAVFMANYLEGIKRIKLRELFLGLCIAVPLLLFVVQMYQ